jgi:hypothetical protein
MKLILLILLTLMFSLPAGAQNWALSFSSGPFVFGDFAENQTRIRPFSNGDSAFTHSLSAATRPGAVAGLERYWSPRLSIRLESTFTESPLAVKSGSGDDSVSLDIGDLSVTTFALPLVFRFNRGGDFRPLLFLGPAYVVYDINQKQGSGVVPLFTGARGEAGGIGGAGLEWWWSNRFGLRAAISDIVTESPLERSDFQGPVPDTLEIKTAHNLHTTVGLAYRF